MAERTVGDFKKFLEENEPDIVEMELGVPFKTLQGGELVEVIMITKVKYDSLNASDDFLSCLEGAGVDNWDGYNLAQDMMEEHES